MNESLRNIRNLKSLLFGRLPGQLIIQYSNRCNADCPQCGIMRSEKIKRYKLDKNYVKKLIETAAKKAKFTHAATAVITRKIFPILFRDSVL